MMEILMILIIGNLNLTIKLKTIYLIASEILRFEFFCSLRIRKLKTLSYYFNIKKIFYYKKIVRNLNKINGLDSFTK
jgi:hypothetical protein